MTPSELDAARAFGRKEAIEEGVGSANVLMAELERERSGYQLEHEVAERLRAELAASERARVIAVTVQRELADELAAKQRELTHDAEFGQRLRVENEQFRAELAKADRERDITVAALAARESELAAARQDADWCRSQGQQWSVAAEKWSEEYASARQDAERMRTTGQKLLYFCVGKIGSAYGIAIRDFRAALQGAVEAELDARPDKDESLKDLAAARQEIHDKSLLIDVVHQERDAARAELAAKPNKDELWAAIRGRDEKINKLVKELAAAQNLRAGS
jgi:hypothetical protein